MWHKFKFFFLIELMQRLDTYVGEGVPPIHGFDENSILRQTKIIVKIVAHFVSVGRWRKTCGHKGGYCSCPQL